MDKYRTSGGEFKRDDGQGARTIVRRSTYKKKKIITHYTIFFMRTDGSVYDLIKTFLSIYLNI